MSSSATRPTKNEIVSFESEQLILVDGNDTETGTLDKSACHNGDGVLHRAFSLFVFNAQGELLLQQRAAGKRLWPLYWSNSCCSHPRAGESMDYAVARRLDQELGLRAELGYVYKFQYQASYGSAGSENELCSVYLGRTAEEPMVNTSEIAAYEWIAPTALTDKLERRPDEFTPWFRMEWDALQRDHAEKLKGLTTP